MATPSANAKRKRSTSSATRRAPSQTKKKSADTPLFNASHINGFIVGVMTGAIASLGIVAGINPSALPAAITPSTAGTVESAPLPSFTFLIPWKMNPSAWTPGVRWILSHRNTPNTCFKRVLFEPLAMRTGVVVSLRSWA